MKLSLVRGAIWAVIWSFPLAALFALLFRFPFPFGGYGNGPDAAALSFVAVLFYGAIGGFPLLLILGAVSGALAQTVGKPDSKRVRYLCLCFSFFVSLVCVFILSVLDKIIGPW